jgi:demethylmenaquinone methyltransferase/2-methoxy-6-polyprenyl-1,4-benzoquinol methylase
MTRQGKSSSHAVWSASDLEGNPHEAADKADRVRAMFAAIADSYDLNNRLHSLGRDQAWRRRAVDLCDVRPGDRVLDVACGTGDLAEAFARARPASVCGIDFTEPMLAIARSKAARRRRPAGEPMPTFRHGDALSLPFGNASFDIASIAFGIRNVSDPLRAMKEMRRVLGAGGRLVVLEFSQPKNTILRFLAHLYRDHLMPMTATCLARDRSGAYRYLPRSVATFADRAALAALMRAAGFSSITIHPMTFGICAAYLGRVEGP